MKLKGKSTELSLNAGLKGEIFKDEKLILN